MGLTPLGGVMMGTRTGDLDPAIIPFVIDREPEMADAERIRHVFNKESGLLGISEKSSDMRDIIAGKNAGDEKCALAYDLYVDRLRKYIAQYFGVLNGADAIVFTAGIGENSAEVRASVLRRSTSRAITNSSSVGITNTLTADSAVVMSPTCPKTFFSGSTSIPNQVRPSKTEARTSAEFSPIPAVKVFVIPTDEE